MQIIERVRLYKAEREWLTLSREIQLAREIHSRLLPAKPPGIPGYDMTGTSRAARSVGGDFFDFLLRGDRQLTIWLGDVVGKGLPAALLMANLQASIRAQTLTGAPIPTCLERANRSLCHSTASESFASLFYGVLDYQCHRFRYANAGHNAPFLVKRDGSVERPRTGATVLGFFEDWATETAEVTFAPGDLLVIFSDGITEATDADEEQFGEGRLSALVRNVRSRSASGVVEAILEAVNSYTAGLPQCDDMTLVAMRREPEG